MKKVVILGGGVAGLSAGYFLAKSGLYEVVVLEQAPDVGGLCASFEHNGFTLDHGAHKMYSTVPGILDELRNFMGERIIKLPKKNRIYLKGHLLDYPLSLGNLLKVLGPITFIRLGLGYALAAARSLIDKSQPASYEEYMIRYFGKPTYRLIFEPLADKVWGNPGGLHAEMARARVPASNGWEVILKLLGLKRETIDTNAEFFYYPRKGFGDFPQKLKEDIKALGGNIFCNIRVKSLAKTGNAVTSVEVLMDSQMQTFPCDYLISTIPLGSLSRFVFADKTNGFNHYADDLQFRHLNLVYIVIKKPFVLKDQWIFFPEREYIFSRIFEQKQMNPDLGPQEKTVVCCDFTCDENSWQWIADDDELAQKCVDGLVKAGLIQHRDVEEYFVKRQKNFYPRYDTGYVEKLKACSDQLKMIDNLLLTGRLGMYNYNNSDHCFDMGRFISQKLVEGEQTDKVWTALEERVAAYRIVD